MEHQYILAEKEEEDSELKIKRKRFLNRLGMCCANSFPMKPLIQQKTVNLWKLHRKVEDLGGFLEVNWQV